MAFIFVFSMRKASWRLRNAFGIFFAGVCYEWQGEKRTTDVKDEPHSLKQWILYLRTSFAVLCSLLHIFFASNLKWNKNLIKKISFSGSKAFFWSETTCVCGLFRINVFNIYYAKSYLIFIKFSWWRNKLYKFLQTIAFVLKEFPPEK